MKALNEGKGIGKSVAKEETGEKSRREKDGWKRPP
jgi:hypothetical protein